MFGSRMGTYWVGSESNPRFNKTWRKDGLVIMGKRKFMKEWVDKKCKELGLDSPPSNLEFGFMKD